MSPGNKIIIRSSQSPGVNSVPVTADEIQCTRNYFPPEEKRQMTQLISESVMIDSCVADLNSHLFTYIPGIISLISKALIEINQDGNHQLISKDKLKCFNFHFHIHKQLIVM